MIFSIIYKYGQQGNYDLVDIKNVVDATLIVFTRSVPRFPSRASLVYT